MGAGEAGVFEYADGAGGGFGVPVAADDLEGGGREVVEDLLGLAFAEGLTGGIPFQVGVGDHQSLRDYYDLGHVALFEFDAVMGWSRQAAEEGGAAVGLGVGLPLQKALVAEGR